MPESEVARIRRQIELEYEACTRLFTDFTPTARHEFITKRQENIGGYFEELSRIMPPEEAIVIVAETLNAIQGGESHASV